MNSTSSVEEIIDFIASGTTPESVMAFRPTLETSRRVENLVDRRKDGTISPEEQTELEDYLQLEHLMILAKARARRHLKV